MSETASLYFQTVVVTGIFLLLNGLPKFATNDLGRFLVYLSLGMLCAVASGIAFAYDPPHFLLSHGLASVPLMLLFAAVIFWIVNAGLVGGLASLVSNDPFPGVWRILNQHLLGFYIADSRDSGRPIVAVAVGRAGDSDTIFRQPSLPRRYRGRNLDRRSAIWLPRS